MPIIYWLAIAAVLIYVSQRTVFGQAIAVGSNERAAQLSGVNVDRVKVGAYALTGILVAIAPSFKWPASVPWTSLMQVADTRWMLSRRR